MQPPRGADSVDSIPRPSCAGFLPIGEIVDRYVIQRVVGAGGMGVVYAARDPQLERDLAIKVVKVAGVEEVRAAQARLLHEARALARLSHPNLAAVYDIGMHGDDMFIALELLDGPNLRDWLATAPRGRREILETLCAAGRGLAATHAAGIVHRDIKPENIVVGRGGRVGVIDFGLAVHGERDDDYAAAFSGTPAYMSPEQLRGRPAGPASDQFSFAVMAHEALFGAHPFAGRTLDERRRAVQHGPVRVRGSIAAVLHRALRAEPTARYPSIDALLAALEGGSHRHGRRATGDRPSSPRLTRWSARG
ncbi:MAG: serine/threonine-protein kinase [Kofleriaceae bacterium]